MKIIISLFLLAFSTTSFSSTRYFAEQCAHTGSFHDSKAVYAGYMHYCKVNNVYDDIPLGKACNYQWVVNKGNSDDGSYYYFPCPPGDNWDLYDVDVDGVLNGVDPDPYNPNVPGDGSVDDNGDCTNDTKTIKGGTIDVDLNGQPYHVYGNSICYYQILSETSVANSSCKLFDLQGTGIAVDTASPSTYTSCSCHANYHEQGELCVADNVPNPDPDPVYDSNSFGSVSDKYLEARYRVKGCHVAKVEEDGDYIPTYSEETYTKYTIDEDYEECSYNENKEYSFNELRSLLSPHIPTQLFNKDDISFDFAHAIENYTGWPPHFTADIQGYAYGVSGHLGYDFNSPETLGHFGIRTIGIRTIKWGPHEIETRSFASSCYRRNNVVGVPIDPDVVIENKPSFCFSPDPDPVPDPVPSDLDSAAIVAAIKTASLKNQEVTEDSAVSITDSIEDSIVVLGDIKEAINNLDVGNVDVSGVTSELQKQTSILEGDGYNSSGVARGFSDISQQVIDKKAELKSVWNTIRSEMDGIMSADLSATGTITPHIIQVKGVDVDISWFKWIDHLAGIGNLFVMAATFLGLMIVLGGRSS